MSDRQQLSEGIGILYRVHVYLYKLWVESWGEGPCKSAEGVRLAMNLIASTRADMLDERDEIDESMQGIA